MRQVQRKSGYGGGLTTTFIHSGSLPATIFVSCADHAKMHLHALFECLIVVYHLHGGISRARAAWLRRHGSPAAGICRTAPSRRASRKSIRRTCAHVRHRRSTKAGRRTAAGQRWQEQFGPGTAGIRTLVPWREAGESAVQHARRRQYKQEGQGMSARGTRRQGSA